MATTQSPTVSVQQASHIIEKELILPNIHPARDNSIDSHQHHGTIAERDPRIDDTPRLDAKTEWYYVQAHLYDGAAVSSGDPSHTIIVCLFRHQSDLELEPTRSHDWAVIYATLDWETTAYKTYSKVPSSMPKYVLKSLEDSDDGISKAVKTMLKAGPSCKDVPSFMPDGLLSSPVQVKSSLRHDDPALNLVWDDGASLVGNNGEYHLKVPEIGLDIESRATRPMMLHGNHGETLSDNSVRTMSLFLALH